MNDAHSARSSSDTTAPATGTLDSVAAHNHHGNFFGLALGSVGVVFGDIGTSPLYALRESLHHVSRDGTFTRAEVIGIVSLLLWSILLIVTIKYVVFMMRADNKGEGGMLSLLALVQQALGKRTGVLFAMAIAGAALFYGDSIITPAISVLSAVEGLELVTPAFKPYVVPIAIAILISLFAIQSRGTGKVAVFFGPATAVWFLVLAVLGIIHIGDDLEILWALSPLEGARFLINHGLIGFIVLGAVFLAVTGAEALYADMGHFGKKPIQAAWLFFVMPCLMLNYLGQGAFMLAHPEAIKNPLFLMAPSWALVPLLLLATIATVIASQAVITGAYSITQQAIQLGLLPRMDIRYTSETQAGQIYIPKVTNLILIGVIILVIIFQSSSRLANAYGIAVTGAMVLDTLLFCGFLLFVWKWRPLAAFSLIIPILCIEMAYFTANAMKILDGGWLPLSLAGILTLIMATWVKGTRIVAEKTRRDTIPLTSLFRSLEKVQRVSGTAIFLTGDPDAAPHALLHNMKHNKVLHQSNVILTVRTAGTPRVNEDERTVIEQISADFWRVSLKYGYMETPNVPKALAKCRKEGIKFDIMSTSFFLGRRKLKPSANNSMPIWQDKLYIHLSQGAADATEFFHLPSGRVVELGSQILI